VLIVAAYTLLVKEEQASGGRRGSIDRFTPECFLEILVRNLTQPAPALNNEKGSI
jgi:hypothetical protein